MESILYLHNLNIRMKKLFQPICFLFIMKKLTITIINDRKFFASNFDL